MLCDSNIQKHISKLLVIVQKTICVYLMILQSKQPDSLWYTVENFEVKFETLPFDCIIDWLDQAKYKSLFRDIGLWTKLDNAIVKSFLIDSWLKIQKINSV